MLHSYMQDTALSPGCEDRPLFPLFYGGPLLCGVEVSRNTVVNILCQAWGGELCTLSLEVK